MFDILVIFLCLHLALAYFQNDYLIKYKRYTDLYVNSDYIRSYNFSFDYINRTTRVANGNATLIKRPRISMFVFVKNLHFSLEVFQFKLQTYKLLSNEYRYFPVFYEENPCLAMAADVFGNSISKFDTNIKRCPFSPGFYYLRNVIYDQSKFPPYAPRGRFMFELKVLERETVLMSGKLYVHVVPTNPLEIEHY